MYSSSMTNAFFSRARAMPGRSAGPRIWPLLALAAALIVVVPVVTIVLSVLGIVGILASALSPWRRAAAPSSPTMPGVIEGEYTVVAEHEPGHAKRPSGR